MKNDHPKNSAYVYLLIDPNTNEPFYVGKGHGYRDHSHMKPHKLKNPQDTTNPFLYHKINSLCEKGTPPTVKRVYENLSEEKAYEIEHKLIEEYGRRFVDGGKLFNISATKGGTPIGIAKPWSEEAKEHFRIWCKANRKYDPTYQELWHDYIVCGKTREMIAEENGVSVVLVKLRLKELQIKKPKNIRYPERNKWKCQECGVDFTTPKSVESRKYCSIRCSTKAKAKEHDQKRSGEISSKCDA